MINKILVRLLYIIVRIIGATYRFRFIQTENLENAKHNKLDGCYITTMWHQNAVSGILSQNNNPHCVFVSRSKDGEFVSFTCKKLGHSTVRGSSSRGGKEAMRAMIKVISEDKIPGAITVDGPKGPSKIIKPGVYEIAKRSNSLILPFSTLAVSYWSFSKSWDNFRLPKPFTKIIGCYGTPIEVNNELNNEYIDQLDQVLTKSLNECEEKALLAISRRSI